MKRSQTTLRAKVSRANSYQDVDDAYALVDVIVSSGAFVERDRRDPISGKWEPFMRGLEISPDAVRLDRLKSGAPVLDNHQDNSDIDAVVGSVDDVWFESSPDGDLLMARLKISKVSSREKEIAQKIKSGIITAVSVGADIHRDIDVTQDGDSMTKLLSIDWEPYEVSLVPIPADELSIIRSRRPTDRIKESAMPKTKSQIKRMDGDVVKEVVEDIVEEVVEDADVATEVTEEIISEVMADDADEKLMDEKDKEAQADSADKEEYMGDEDKEELMDEEDKEEQAEDEDKEELAKLIRKRAIAKMRAKSKAAKMSTKHLKSRRSRVVVDESHKIKYVKDTRSKIGEAITGKINNFTYVIRDKSGRVTDTYQDMPQNNDPNEFKNMSFADMGREAFYRDGQHEARNWSSHRVYDELFSLSKKLERRSSGPFHVSSDFDNLFTDSVNKAVLQSYDTQRGKQTFDPFVSKIQVKDFKTQERVSLGEFGKLQEVAPGVDAPITSMKDSKEEYKVKSYSNTFQMTRQGFANDDTGQLQIVLTSGMSAADLESDLVYDELTKGKVGGSTWYSSARKNLSTGVPLNSGSTPYAGLKAIYEGLAKQKGLDVDTPLNLSFKYLLVPTALYFEALQTQGVAYPATPANPNPYASLYTVLHEPRLDSTATNDYYGIAAEAGSFRPFIELAYISGQTTPIMKYQESFGNDVLSWKMTHDVAAKMLDYRLAYKCEG